jgi:hypothetical protein
MPIAVLIIIWGGFLTAFFKGYLKDVPWIISTILSVPQHLLASIIDVFR